MEVAKKLEFLDMSMQLVDAVDEHSTYKDYLTAFSELEGKLSDAGQELSKRYAMVLNTSSEKACGAGASDLRRLKRQFSSLKNTYILYDVKEGFIDGLRGGLPDGTEAANLAEVETELDMHSGSIKTWKAKNQETEEHLLRDVTNFSSQYNRFKEEKATTSKTLAATVGELKSRGAQDQAHMRTDLAEEVGRMAELTQEARELESRIAACQAEAAELQEAIASEEEHMVLLKRKGIPRLPEDDVKSRTPWCQELSRLLTELSGVEVANINESSIELHLHRTHDKNTPGPSQKAMLLLQFSDDNTEIRQAELLNTGIDIDDIVREANIQHRPLTFVVRESLKRLQD
eukprot:jgi/Botrbrau1/21438/Bobra.0216s0047.2